MPTRAPDANAFAFIFITVLINMIGFGVVIPVMPQLIMTVTGQDLAHAAKWGGVLSLVYAVMQFFMMPVVGALSDQYGRRPIILLSLFAYGLDFLLMALAPTIALLVAARMLAGGFAATFSTANAYIADISPPEKRAANFGLLGAAFGLGFIIGPGIGGLLGHHFGPRAPFFFVAALGLINLVYGYFFLPETLAKENRRAFDFRRANPVGNIIQFSKYPIILPIAASIFLFQLGHWAFPSVWSYYAEARFKWTPDQIGYSLMFVGLAAALVQGGLTRVVIPKIGEHRAAIFGLTISVLIYAGYAFAQQAWMIYALIAVGSLGGFTAPALQGIMSKTTPANAQGALQGAIGSLQGLTMIIGPYGMTQVFAAFIEPGTPIAIGGVTILTHGAPFYFPGAPFVLASMLAAGAALVLIAAFRAERRALAAAK
jgi:DHA1 family tetracycline resistance protein-like MFS transporter